MVIAYRKATELKQDEVNFNAWLQGMYFYEALSDVAPILRALSKAKRPVKYSEQPYDLYGRKAAKEEEEKEKKSFQKNISAMEIFTVNFNKRFAQKKVNANGGQRTDAGD